MYTDPSGDFFWIIPNISWSKNGGLSIGVSFVFGIPGAASFQVGFGCNLKSGEFYGYAGATLGLNTAYVSYSPSGGWNAGYTAGVSIYSGFPVSTNFATVGVNYNINSGNFSGNVSAWQVDQNGLVFNPSVSAMIFPEQTTNLIRGGRFLNNEKMFRYQMSKTDMTCQDIIDYYGFEGTYDPTLTSKNYQAPDYWGATNIQTGQITYGNLAFDNYATLKGVYTKESFTSRNVLNGKIHELPSNMKGLGMDTYLEEADGYIHAYENQGLYLGNKLPWQGIETYQSVLKANDIVAPTYTNRFNWIYKIPRKW